MLASRSGIDYLIRLPTLIQPDFTPTSKPSSSEKAFLYVSGLGVLLNVRHSNQTLYRYRYYFQMASFLAQPIKLLTNVKISGLEVSEIVK